MSIETINSTDPFIHATNLQSTFQDLIDHLRESIEQVDEPRFQALLETTAEVLIGLRTAYRDYGEGMETAWRIPRR